MIQAILFDLFETLVTERDRGQMLGPTVAERLGLEPDIYKAEWRKRQQARMTGAFPDYASALKDLCAELGLATGDEAIRQIEADRIASFAAAFARPGPGIREALQRIRSTGIGIGLVSNASYDEIAAYDSCWLAELVDAAVFSCRVGCMKPGPEIYLLACERLGVDPVECVYVGDGGFGELPAAAQLGMTVYCATWYRDRWPDTGSVPYAKLAVPDDLLHAVLRGI